MSSRYKGGVISATAPTTSTSAAKGIWSTTQLAQAVAAGTWPRSPGAPTIGTATTSTPTTASVPFTAPSDLGTGSVTYTATSSPGGLTGTGASPITITGLTTGTAYTFTVTATTPGGTGPASAASNSVTPSLPAIGSAYGGGYFAGQISTSADGVATHNLVVCDITVGQATGKTWGVYGDFVAVPSKITGPANSAYLAGLGAAYQAAIFCEAVNTGGYTDWYLPAQNELEVCYYFLKPSTTSNNTSAGSNANAVSPEPISTAYSSGSPAQTSATNFRSGASSQEFDSSKRYWSSTERNLYSAFEINFDNGLAGADGAKNFTVVYTRAVRRVAV